MRTGRQEHARGRHTNQTGDARDARIQFEASDYQIVSQVRACATRFWPMRVWHARRFVKVDCCAFGSGKLGVSASHQIEGKEKEEKSSEKPSAAC